MCGEEILLLFVMENNTVIIMVFFSFRIAIITGLIPPFKLQFYYHSASCCCGWWFIVGFILWRECKSVAPLIFRSSRWFDYEKWLPFPVFPLSCHFPTFSSLACPVMQSFYWINYAQTEWDANGRMPRDDSGNGTPSYSSPLPSARGSLWNMNEVVGVF